MKRVSSNYFFMARVPHYLGSYTTGYKKRKSKDFLFWVPSGILSLRSSDFVDDFRFAQATSSMTNPYGINGKSRLVNLVLLPLRYGNKDIIRDNISECHR